MDYYKIIPIFKEVTNGKNKYDVKSEKYSDSLDSEICEVLGILKGKQYTSVTVYEKDYDDKKYVSVDPKIGVDIFYESTRAE
jgi:predicted transcriptional regulator